MVLNEPYLTITASALTPSPVIEFYFSLDHITNAKAVVNLFDNVEN